MQVISTKPSHRHTFYQESSKEENKPMQVGKSKYFYLPPSVQQMDHEGNLPRVLVYSVTKHTPY